MNRGSLSHVEGDMAMRADPRIVKRYREDYGDQVMRLVKWRDLPEFMESNGFDPKGVWEVAQDLGLRAEYRCADLLMSLGF